MTLFCVSFVTLNAKKSTDKAHKHELTNNKTLKPHLSGIFLAAQPKFSVKPEFCGRRRLITFEAGYSRVKFDGFRCCCNACTGN